MIIYVVTTGGYEAISTEYGDTGRSEIETLTKRLNLKKESITNYGSPYGEVLKIPLAKSTIQTAGKPVTYAEYTSAKSAKFEEWRQRMARVPTTTVKPTTTSNGHLSDEDEPIRHNRRDTDRKNSRKENIRNQRRTNTKRSYPTDSDDDESLQ